MISEPDNFHSIVKSDGASSRIQLECVDSGQTFVLEIPKDATSDSEEGLLKSM